jgi:xylan 1,4-beta-xylosidase
MLTDAKTYGMRTSILFPILLFLIGISGASLSGAQTEANPAIPGDHPDPSIIRAGNTYWATATSSEWLPAFPLFRSNDLKTWKQTGAVFADQPEWAVGSFWAPETTEDHGSFLVYYTARKRKGPLCVAVATSSTPQGPYVDHGPLVCQEDGSIDPSFVRDEKNVPYLIWKEDGNSQGKPTPIWAQQLTPDLIHLEGEKHLLLRQTDAWEGSVIEAPYIFRHSGRFYLFYAGNACCGVECHYAEGVARADQLLGPWQKDPQNPIIRANANWKCPGHGTAVHANSGNDYFLYHAYPVKSSIYLGRESLLDRIVWKEDWPVIDPGTGSGQTLTPAKTIRDTFHTARLAPEWQWPVNSHPSIKTGDGTLVIAVQAAPNINLVARPIPSATFRASVEVKIGDTEEYSVSEASLVLWGDGKAAVGLGVHDHHLELWELCKTGTKILWTSQKIETSKITLAMSAEFPEKIQFSYISKKGLWEPAGLALNPTKLPIWDRGLRIGLFAEGALHQRATFSGFQIHLPSMLKKPIK